MIASATTASAATATTTLPLRSRLTLRRWLTLRCCLTLRRGLTLLPKQWALHGKEKCRYSEDATKNMEMLHLIFSVMRLL